MTLKSQLMNKTNRVGAIPLRSLLIATLLCVSALESGCIPTRGFQPTNVVKHPDSPMLIMATKSGYVKVVIYDKVNNKMIEYGWVKMDDGTHGWTITKYDWEKFIQERR